MDNELLHTEKSRHYEIFREACSILAGSNVSLADRLRVVELAYDMNKSGKRRKMTKQEYINLLISSKTPLLRMERRLCVMYCTHSGSSNFLMKV